jgi:hypothetical protein
VVLFGSRVVLEIHVREVLAAMLVRVPCVQHPVRRVQPFQTVAAPTMTAVQRRFRHGVAIVRVLRARQVLSVADRCFVPADVVSARQKDKRVRRLRIVVRDRRASLGCVADLW